MRKGFLGSIAALAAGAASAWAQPPGVPAQPAGVPIGALGPVAPEPPIGGPPRFGGFKPGAIPGNAGFAPAPAIMPPGNYGPPDDPLGLGPVGGFGPPPGPMYPMPGPYAQQTWQPSPPGEGHGGLDGSGDAGCTAPHWWVNGEYLLWFTRGQHLAAPLVTSSAPSDGGVIGATSTTVLSGSRSLSYGAISGMRMGVGFFGDADRRFGFQLSGFFTEHKPFVQDYGTLSNFSGIPTLARPFVDIAGASGALVLSGPTIGAATVRVRSDTQTIGVEPVGIWNVYRAPPGSRRVWSFDLIGGYEFLQVRESLRIISYTQMNSQIPMPVFTNGPFGVISQSTSLQPAVLPLGGAFVNGPAVVNIRDEFQTTNRFNGGVLGFRTEARSGMFTGTIVAKVALGDMNERVQILGDTTFVDTTGRSGTPTTFGLASAVNSGRGGAVGGVLANPGNIGTYVRDRFTYIPQIGGNWGIAITGGLTAWIGVDFLYFPEVVRPGQAAQPFISSTSLPFSPNFGAPGGPRSLPFKFQGEDLWVGGVNVGMMLRY
jgi:hypothetical protein